MKPVMENIKPNNDAILNGNTEKAVKPFSQTEKSFIREQFDEPDNLLLLVKVTFDIFKVILRKIPPKYGKGLVHLAASFVTKLLATHKLPKCRW